MIARPLVRAPIRPIDVYCSNKNCMALKGMPCVKRDGTELTAHNGTRRFHQSRRNLAAKREEQRRANAR